MEKQSFEQAMKALDDIVDKLSGGNLPLDEMMKLYEKGNKLAEYCMKLLDGYEGKLTQLSAEGNEKNGAEK